MNFIEKLNLLMKEKNISRGELSRGAKVPYTTIVNFYEQGYENVKLSTLKRLASYFGVSIDYLADDNINDRHPVTEKDLKRAEQYMKAKASDDPVVKSLVEAIDKLLGIE